jgi:hypothetical protein
MKINSVKLNNDGLKGLIVNYAQDFVKDGRIFLDEAKGYTRKAPIHAELSEAIESLVPFLLDICGYHEETRKPDILNTTITGITYNNKGFVITGKKKILAGDKSINLVTPLLDEQSYPDADEVSKIMDVIYEEVEAYMSGLKSMTDEQLVMKFNEWKDDFDVDTFNSKTDAEKREIADLILREMKAFAFFPDEVEEKEETAEVVETPVTKEFLEEQVESVVEATEEEDNFDLPPVTFKPAPLKVVDGDNGEFKVVANEERVSTAKRRQA